VRVGPPPGAVKEAMKERGGPDPGSSGKPAGTYMEIPAKYYDPEKSGINCTVTRGWQTFDIKLE
jgi:hypothetical protein